MLSAFFDIQTTAPKKEFGRKTAANKKKKAAPPQPSAEPEGTEAATTHIHAGFVPLPPETNVPKPAEADGQAWQAYAESGEVKDDDVAVFKADWDLEWEETNEDAEGSEPDFEPESLDPCISTSPGIEDSLGSSVDDTPFFLTRRRSSHAAAAQGVPVYTGPQLCCEDEDFD